MRKQVCVLLTLLVLFSIPGLAVSRVENCIANGQFSSNRADAVKKCVEHTTLPLKDCEAKVQCFGPISFCMTGTTTGDSLESVIAECSRAKSAADCEATLKCFSNVSSCEANGQTGTTAEEALNNCSFKTKMNRAQCQQSLDCQEAKYPMPARPRPLPSPKTPPASSQPPPNVR